MNITIDSDVLGASQKLAEAFAVYSNPQPASVYNSEQEHALRAARAYQRFARRWCWEHNFCPKLLAATGGGSTKKLIAFYASPISMQSTDVFSLPQDAPIKYHFVCLYGPPNENLRRIEANLATFGPDAADKVVLLVNSTEGDLVPKGHDYKRYHIDMGNLTEDAQNDIMAGVILAHCLLNRVLTEHEFLALLAGNTGTIPQAASSDEPRTVNYDAYRMMDSIPGEPELNDCHELGTCPSVDNPPPIEHRNIEQRSPRPSIENRSIEQRSPRPAEPQPTASRMRPRNSLGKRRVASRTPILHSRMPEKRPRPRALIGSNPLSATPMMHRRR